jgi:glycosyltransferase involved in cell wall biosynthesis
MVFILPTQMVQKMDVTINKPNLLRITTVPISLDKLLCHQMKFMKSNGFEVTMMSADGPEISKIVEREECEHIIIPLTRQITPFKDLVALYVLTKHLIRIKPNIVHTHTPKAGLIGMMAAWLCRVPIRIHTVAGLPLQTSVGAKRELLIGIEKLTYYFANHIWPNSRSLYNFIKTHKLTNLSKLHIIGCGSSNGIDIDEYDPNSIKQDILNNIKSQMGYDKNFRYLLFVGRVVKDKGIEELIEVFNKIQLIHKDLKLILVGPFEQELDPIPDNIIHEIRTNKNIISIGYSNHVKYYMAMSNLFVFPSHREGFPNVLLQAGLMGLPIICSDIDGNIDIVDNNLTGVLFPVKNVNLFEDALNKAMNNEEMMIKYAQNLKTIVLNNYDRRIIHKNIFARYKFMLANVK